MVINAKMLFPQDVNLFYEVTHATTGAGYDKAKNGSNIYECVYTKDLIDYNVTGATTEGEYITITLEENTDFDNEYLQNAALELQCKIDDENVSIETKEFNTCFVRAQRHYSINAAEAITNYKKLVKLCRANNIKLSYKNHYKKYLEENEATYIEAIEEAHNTFNQLIDAAKKVQDRGIHIYCQSDKYLNVMQDIKAKYEVMFYRSTVISKYESIANTLKEYVEEIEAGHTSYIKLCL